MQRRKESGEISLPLREFSLKDLLDEARTKMIGDLYQVKGLDIFGYNPTYEKIDLPGGDTKYSEILEKILNIDRIINGLAPIEFSNRPLAKKQEWGRE